MTGYLGLNMDIALHPRLQFVNDRGKPIANGAIYVYNHKTRELADIFSNSTLTTELDNPTTLDSLGTCSLYVPFNKSYDIEILDSDGYTLYTSSNIGMLDLSEFDTTSSSEISGVVTISVSNQNIIATSITTPSNTDLDIVPDTGYYFVVGGRTLDTSNTNYDLGSYSLQGYYNTSTTIAFGTSSQTYRFRFTFGGSSVANNTTISFANAATGNGPTIGFNSTATTKVIEWTSGTYANSGLVISGVAYRYGGGTGKYLKSDGAGSTYWEA